MSRIYDALKRAQSERHSDPETPVPRAFAPRPTSPVSVAEEQPANINQLQRVPLDTLPAVRARAQGAAIGRDVWQPVWNNLPSLQRRGSYVEQFRGLRSRLLGLRQQRPLKTILVSSGLAQEGKTFVAVNHALTLASSKDQRVLLIDGDMRRPSVHKLLGTNQGPGLGEYLTSKAEIKDILRMGRSAEGSDDLPSALDTLTFIPAGSEGEKTPDFSGGQRFEQLLSSVEADFDWIIIDSPPVNLVTDGVDMARACDGVLFIVRSGNSRMASVKKALTSLKATQVLGIVLNAARDRTASYSYYGD